MEDAGVPGDYEDLAMRKRRALLCFYDVPRIDRDSGSRSIFDFVSFLLGADFSVAYVAVNGISDARYAEPLQQQGVVVVDGMKVDLEDVLAWGNFDLALLCSWTIGELYLPTIRRLSPQTRVIVNSLDVHFVRDARRIVRDPTLRLLDPDFANQLAGELNVYAAADGVLTVSDKEADLINDIVGERDLARGVPDSEDITPSTHPLKDRKGIVFVGAYRHPPNVQAVRWLCREILPLVDSTLLEQHPTYVLGDGMDDSLRKAAVGLPGVRMIGWVPSVLPYYHRARISVAPLLYGAGTKRKLVEALLTKTPTVATSVGAEGLGLVDEKHVLVADEPAKFAEAIERLLRNKALWGRLAREGYAHAAPRHSRDAERARFLAAVEHALGKEPKGSHLPEHGRDQYWTRLAYQDRARAAPEYRQEVVHVRERILETAPVGSTVVVVSKGDDQLLELDGRIGWHFPQLETGVYAGDHSADSATAIAHLEKLRARGGGFLVVPESAGWWLEHYGEFARHVETNYQQVLDEPGVCKIWKLRTVLSGSDTSTNGDLQAALAPRMVPDEGSSDEADTRLIAFYLPQFHPIPENDEWWGPGFTEWRNVTTARPQFQGHHQPRLPSELGFYDLRMPEIRAAQAELARAYGIHGFCYYHYWFGGKRLLHQPFDDVLRSGEPDFPFCLCWANEPWSRRWDGLNQDVLQHQAYSANDDVAHIRWLLEALADPRAITIEGKPLFLVYQARDLSDPAATVEIWRREVAAAGLPGIYLLAVETGWDAGWDATQVGFDGKVLFQPQFSTLRECPLLEVGAPDTLQVYDYADVWPLLANPEPVSYRRYESVFASWDNTARRGSEATVVHNALPATYEKWLRYTIEKAGSQPADHRLVFLNAWNEWAEGAYLEPDLEHGRAYLEATRRALVGSADHGATSALR
jgi:glycosyltransferase involved in cell wall biosynthesis